MIDGRTRLRRFSRSYAVEGRAASGGQLSADVLRVRLCAADRLDRDQRARYERISGFALDEPGSEFPFSSRLARDCDWSREYALRVIGEYRRFSFLAVSAGHPVTPSDQVDQAWHLHLLYTRSYWERFCGEVLGTALHHEPTRGGPRERSKFSDWYARTLESYRRLFGEEAPPDIWPASAIRFGEDLHFRRVNTRRAWVIAKPWARRS